MPARAVLGALLSILCTCSWADLSPRQTDAIVNLYDGATGYPQGTGYFIGARRMITAAHVVSGVQRLGFYANGRWVPMRCEWRDPTNDVALLNSGSFASKTWLKLGSGATVDRSIAIYGYPGWERTLKVTTGQCTGVNKRFKSEGDGRQWWRTACTGTAKVMGGFSGGPVIDRETNMVIGTLTNCDFPDPARYSNSWFTDVRLLY